MIEFNPLDWYWLVGGAETRVWSSARGTYAQADDTDYQAWLAAGGSVTRIASEEELTDALRPFGLKGPYIAPADVHAERDRRLAGGFDYDFGDDRGVHRIATTPGDMVGWQDVTTWATVQKLLDNTSATLPIKTETGPTIVTPGDWFLVLEAATAFRQPIWGASFVLEAMDPIPADYADNLYWE